MRGFGPHCLALMLEYTLDCFFSTDDFLVMFMVPLMLGVW